MCIWHFDASKNIQQATYYKPPGARQLVSCRIKQGLPTGAKACRVRQVHCRLCAALRRRLSHPAGPYHASHAPPKSSSFKLPLCEALRGLTTSTPALHHARSFPQQMTPLSPSRQRRDRQMP